MKVIFFVIVFTLFTEPVRAALTCEPVTSPLNYSVPLSATVSLGVDSPNGTVLYKGIISQSNAPTYRCTAGEEWLDEQFLNLLAAPFPLSSWKGSPFSGSVYETNISGVGVAIWSELVPASAATADKPVLVWSGRRISQTNIPVRLSLGYSLIKTGIIQPGVVSGSSLPRFGISLKITPSSPGFPWQAISYNFSGGINIVSNTCQTPDVNVDMGKWDAKDFGNIGKVTKWVKSDIVLYNCPTFSGYYSTNSVRSYTNGTADPLPARDLNSLSISFKPLSGIVDAANGIIALNAGTESAQGIGIQLGKGNYSGVVNTINLNEAFSFTPPVDGSSSFNIPLAARYIQTEKELKPGKADAKVVFTINYY